MAVNGTSYQFLNSVGYAKGQLIILPYGNNQDPLNSESQIISFLLNPETITEALQGGWVHKTVPGQNDPVSSWVGNGNRTVNLTLLLIKDTSNNIGVISKGSGISNPTVKSVIGAIASNISGINLSIFNTPPQQGTTTMIFPNLSVQLELDQLRQLRYASLDANNLYMNPPSLIKFHFDQSFINGSTVINSTLGLTQSNGLDNVYWTVDSIEIGVTKWSSNLIPIEAEVKLTLVQFNDINKSKKLVSVI